MTRVKNWHKFQHFKDRKPPWIKLYRDLLDDPEWHELDAEAAKTLTMIWLVASENDGALPSAKKLAFRLRMTEVKLNQLLTQLSHWLDQDDIAAIPDRYQDDAPETETETQVETEAERENPSLCSGARKNVQRETLNPDWPADGFEQFYSAYPRKVDRLDAQRAFEKARKKHRVPWTKLMAAVSAYAATADPQFTKHPATWLNKGCWADENSAGGQNGYRGSGAIQNTGREILPAADKLIERIKSFDRPIPPAICSGEGAPSVRLLPEGRRERPGDVHGGGDGDPVGVSGGGDTARY